MLQPQNILITGASGFIGSAFLRLALERGYLALALTRKAHNELDMPVAPSLHWMRGPLSAPPWDRICFFQPQTCVHCAWVTTPGAYLESPENEALVASSLEFLRGAMDIGVKRILVLGTCAEYASTDQPCVESQTPIAPATAYARAKNLLRVTLQGETRKRGVELVWARVFYPYGPGEAHERLASSIIGKLSRAELVELRTPASVKDYIYCDDLARALLLVLESKFTGPINLGTGVGVSVREIAETLARLLGKPELIRVAPPTAEDALGSRVADSSQLRALGWRPQVPLEAGLARLIASLKPTV